MKKIEKIRNYKIKKILLGIFKRRLSEMTPSVSSFQMHGEDLCGHVTSW